MKCILAVLLLAALALAVDLVIAATGLTMVALVLMIGDLVQDLPESPCNHKCRQGRSCTCPLAKQEPKR